MSLSQFFKEIFVPYYGCSKKGYDENRTYQCRRSVFFYFY